MIYRLGIPIAIAAALAALTAMTIGSRAWPWVFGGALVFLLRQRR